MEAELQQLEGYLHDALSVDAASSLWRGADRLPQFLRELYGFAQVKLLGQTCLLVIDSSRAEAPPAVIRRHLDMLRSRQGGEPVYVRRQVTSYNRKRLIGHKVPFIVPGNQMYLPMLAIDLREHFRQPRSEVPAFGPASQAVLLDALLHALDELRPLDMARRLGYSAMTMSRVFDQLEAAHLGEATTHGRQRRFRFAADRKATWAAAQPFLRSPVKQNLFIERDAPLPGPRAGLAALAHHTRLAPPACSSIAVSRQEWSDFRRQHKVVELPTGDPDGQEVQVWSYPPPLLARGGFVDPLSLYLSLKDDRDERTQACLAEMVGGLGW